MTDTTLAYWKIYTKSINHELRALFKVLECKAHCDRMRAFLLTEYSATCVKHSFLSKQINYKNVYFFLFQSLKYTKKKRGEQSLHNRYAHSTWKNVYRNPLRKININSNRPKKRVTLLLGSGCLFIKKRTAKNHTFGFLCQNGVQQNHSIEQIVS